jgi:hypothetical protein
MTDNPRASYIIQEELADLVPLIKENELLLFKYPDKFSLKLGLKSLKRREQDLLIELQNSKSRTFMDTFDIVVTGDVVKNYDISLSFLGDFTSNLQKIITTIAQSLDRKTPADSTRLDLVATSVGSFKIVLSSHQSQVSDSIQINSLRQLNNLILCGDDKDTIRNFSDNLGKEVMKEYKKFLKTIYSNKANIKFFDTNIPDGFESNTISSDKAEKIYYVVHEIERVPDKIDTYSGTLTGVNVRSNSFELVVDDTGLILTGKFKKDLANKAKELLDRFTKVRVVTSITLHEITGEERKKHEILEFIE